MFSKINRFLSLLLLLVFSLNSYSQDDGFAPMDNPELDEEIVEAVPINDWVPYLIITGILYCAYFYEKKGKSELNSK